MQDISFRQCLLALNGNAYNTGAVLSAALAALSPPPVASGTEGEDG